MQPNMDQAEYRCLIMMARRTKIMGFYAAMFAFAITLLKNPDDLDAFTALLVVGLFGLISLYYLVTQNRFFARRFADSCALIANEQTRKQLHCENSFRRIAHGVFIVLAFSFIAYLGVY